MLICLLVNKFMVSVVVPGLRACPRSDMLNCFKKRNGQRNEFVGIKTMLGVLSITSVWLVSQDSNLNACFTL